MVTAARLSEGGRHVVVLDYVPPYVKVFDQNGRFERSFLRSGAGPGESRRPVALAVSGDTAILVADASGRMMVFGMNGVLRREATDTRMRVLAATAGCGDEWVTYGPKYGRDASRPTWLHRVRLAEAGTVHTVDLIADSLASDMLPMGVAYGLVAYGRRGNRVAHAGSRAVAGGVALRGRRGAPDGARRAEDWTTGRGATAWNSGQNGDWPGYPRARRDCRVRRGRRGRGIGGRPAAGAGRHGIHASARRRKLENSLSRW